ncbi:MAG: FAD-dependent oxidoreductase, partial [Desulforhopalus sp.]
MSAMIFNLFNLIQPSQLLSCGGYLVASADVIIIGGGISGAATALGLVKEGAGKVFIFDEQLPSQRLSRGNFGLTWFMCKGANNPVYAKWCRMATEQWPQFAEKLEQETGYDMELEWT